jgi:iron-sulfur cluster repair protein YtfE (RIC family)
MPLEQHEHLAAWQVAPLGDLVRHLVGTHHQQCRDDMASLETLIALFAMEPGPVQLALLEIRDLLAHFCTGLRAHLAREECDLFPVLLAMEQGVTPGIGKEQLGLMRSLLEEEHVREVGLLRDLRVFTALLPTGQPADHPLARLRAALDGLAGRFQDHVQLENQVLFTRMV